MQTHLFISLSRTWRARATVALCAALAMIAISASARHAFAQAQTGQSADDSPVRLLLDTSFYTGTPQDSHSQTVIAPVASADFKLVAFRIGGDLPFAAGWGRAVADVAGMPLSQSASNFVMGNPDIRGDFEVSSGNVLARVGAGFAFSVADASAGSANSFEGKTALGLASASRGTWNQWWWMLDTYTLFVPGELRYRGEGFAAGAEGAFALTFPGSDSNDRRDTGTLIQFGGFLAAVKDKIGSVGIRERTVIPLTNRRQAPITVGSVSTSGSLLPSQSSLEIYGEWHPMEVLLLGAGFLLNLDEPFGVFGSGQDIWGLRLTAGLAIK
jgi:hypothetical protein